VEGSLMGEIFPRVGLAQFTFSMGSLALGSAAR
jgi:hypothetical protein